MGIANYLKNKAKDIQQERAINKEYNRQTKEEQRLEYNRGQREAAYRQGAGISGMGSVTERTEYGRGGKAKSLIKTTNNTSFMKNQQPQGQPQGRGNSGRGRGGASWGPDWNQAGAMFGGSNGGGSFDIFGGGGERRAPPPMRTRTISPSGKVTIQEPIQQKPMHHGDDIGDLWGTPGVAGGVRKKGERDPYDFIL